jgi:hypothetical protein
MLLDISEQDRVMTILALAQVTSLILKISFRIVTNNPLTSVANSCIIFFTLGFAW